MTTRNRPRRGARAPSEERLGQRLNELPSGTIRVLHDRRVPRTRTNIDHIFVTPTGVHVIDAKRYQDRRPTLKVEGGILRPRVEELLVGSRDHTELVDGVLRQVNVVRAVVGHDVPASGVLCFVDADWPLIGGAFSIRDVNVLWPKRLLQQLRGPGSLTAQVDDLHRHLALRLPPA